MVKTKKRNEEIWTIFKEERSRKMEETYGDVKRAGGCLKLL